MKKVIYLFVLVMGLMQVSKGVNKDSLPCLRLSGRVEFPAISRSEGYSIELWSELELVSVMNSEKSEVFRFDLNKNTQYTILVLEGDSVIKKVFINTNIPWEETTKSHSLELVLEFPGSACNSYEEESRQISGTVNFSYETRSFFYNNDQLQEEKEEAPADITIPKY